MAGSEAYRLVMRRGPQPNQIFEIAKDITNVGRDITNDIIINDREASRHHLRMIRNRDGFVVEDLGSTNGTFINGRRISSVTPLQHGDMIGLGETVTLGFEVMSGSRGAAPASSSSVVAERPGAARAYQPPQAAVSQPPAYPAQQDYYTQQIGYDAPPGLEYDPYKIEEEEGGSTRWLVLGCLVFLVLGCICVTAVGLVAIDQLDLWCEFPGVSNVVGALGYCG